MSIKNIEETYIGDNTGLAKKINKGAEKLVFDILQATQYSTPIPSSIRELVTNACDSQREKEIAIEILSGDKKASDYYITRHGDQYEDSNFDSEYYSLDYLNKDFNRVEITYKKNKGVGYCDTLSIKDYGVGIGGKRLEGILELGFSTKRNTSQNFGAFGLGAKVALSTGVDFYSIESVYNGRRFKMNCFNYKTDFVVPKFNLITGKQNPYITLSNGMNIYYEEVEGTNWTEVSFGVKSHNFDRYQEAIEEQLVYLDNVDFYVIDEEGEKETVNFKSKVIYNSNNLIVSDSWVFRRPHIVIVKEQGSGAGINYGFVDFKELEMQDLYGAVGLKCPIRQSYVNEEGEEIVIQEGVEVTPSREKVIWGDKTKEFIQTLISKASDEVSQLVQEELLEKDFLEWINKCISVTNNSSNYNNSAISVLSNIIDTTSISPRYSVLPSIRFTGPTSLFKGFSLSIHRRMQKKKSEDPLFIKVDVLNWGEVAGKKILYREHRRDQYKDFYFHSKYGDFVTIRKDNLDPDNDNYDSYSYNQELLLPLIKESILFEDYDNVELPDNIKTLYDGHELSQTQRNYSSYLTPEEKRKLNKQIVAYTLREDNCRRKGYYAGDLVWDKIEPVLSSFLNETITTYYGTEEDEEKLRYAAVLYRDYAPTLNKSFKGSSSWHSHPYANHDDACYYFSCLPSRYNENNWSVNASLDTSNLIQIIKISESNLKYVTNNPNYKHIDLFYRDVNDKGEYVCDKVYKDFSNYVYIKSKYPHTVTQIQEGHLSNCFDLDFINPEYHAIYLKVREFLNKFNNPYISNLKLDSEDSAFIDYINECKKYISFSKAAKSITDQKQLEELSSKLFVYSDIPGVDVYDEKLEELMGFIIDFSSSSEHLLPEVIYWDRLNSVGKKQVEIYLNSVKATSISIPSL